MRLPNRAAYACAWIAIGALVFTSVYVAAQGSPRWYAYGYYNAWSNGVKGLIRTYANALSHINNFTAIYIVSIFPNYDWLAVGYYQGKSACGLNSNPTFYTDQWVNSHYTCSVVTSQYPSPGTDSAYEV